MREHTKKASRRNVLKKAGVVGTSLFISSGQVASSGPATQGETCPDGCYSYPIEKNKIDKFTGPGTNGDDVTLSHSTGVTVYEPIWRPSNQVWEMDITISGDAATHFASDGSKAEEMFWQETIVDNYSGDLYSRSDPDWLGGTHADAGSYDYESNTMVSSAISLALSKLNPAVATSYTVANFSSGFINWVADQVNGDRIRRFWDNDNEGSPHKTGSFLLCRYEAAPDSYDEFTVDSTGAAHRENVGINSFDVVLNTGPKPSSAISYSSMGVEEMSGSELESSRVGPALAKEVGPDETVYVAKNPDFVKVEPVVRDTIPEPIQERIEQTM
ncbi:hypothetical protein [Halorussus lipolyticus]|uniref:hypothetical protein n=1 Tax=Halorussus lipolyticus TaxID=3034024 RepID=UPI0023E873CB|nr:hypothetical protein [Halorussus sp. DT80]